MKKSLVYLLASLVVLLVSSSWAGVNYPDIDVTGEISIKAINANNYDGDKKESDKKNYVQQRTRLYLKGELTDGVTANAMAQKMSDGSKMGSADQKKMKDYSTELELKRAYLTVSDVADLVTLTIGKQQIGTKFNSLVYYNSSADAIKGNMTCGPIDLTMVYGKTADAVKNNLYALLGSGKVGEVSVNGGIYRDALNKNGVLTMGISGDIPMIEGLNVGIEYAKQDGENGTLNRKGTALKADVNYACEIGGGKCILGLTLLNTSGDDNNADKDDKDYLGISPSLKMTEIVSDLTAETTNDDGTYKTEISDLNVLILKAGLAMTEKLDLGLAYGTYKANKGTDKKIGTEINLTAGYKQSENIAINLLAAQLSPKKGAGLLGTDKATKLQAGMKISF